MRKGKNKIKIMKIDLFFLPPLPSQDRGAVATPPPPPKFFHRQKFKKKIFTDTWVSGQRVDKSQRKSINGVRENPNGGGLQQLPLLRERVSPVCKAFVCYSQVPNKQGGSK